MKLSKVAAATLVFNLGTLWDIRLTRSERSSILAHKRYLPYCPLNSSFIIISVRAASYKYYFMGSI